MRNDDPRCGQAQDGAGQAADQNVKGAGVWLRSHDWSSEVPAQDLSWAWGES